MESGNPIILPTYASLPGKRDLFHLDKVPDVCKMRKTTRQQYSQLKMTFLQIRKVIVFSFASSQSHRAVDACNYTVVENITSVPLIFIGVESA